MKRLKFKGTIPEILEKKDLAEGRKLTKILFREPIYDMDGDFTGEHTIYPVDVFSEVLSPESISELVTSGRTLMLIARLRSSSYEDQERNKKYGLNLVAKYLDAYQNYQNYQNNNT